jgi:hypothetical protein
VTKPPRIPPSNGRPAQLIQQISSVVAATQGVNEATVAQSFTAYLLAAVLGEAQRLNGGEPIVLPRDWPTQVTERGMFARSEMRADGYYVWLDGLEGWSGAIRQYVSEGLRSVVLPDPGAN